ncbi:hypothetical protein K2W90_06385 [Candidatus Babeliales bacterium]|nr:hypothetical protein [Candidatus Babeliales bacterium]
MLILRAIVFALIFTHVSPALFATLTLERALSYCSQAVGGLPLGGRDKFAQEVFTRERLTSLNELLAKDGEMRRMRALDNERISEAAEYCICVVLGVRELSAAQKEMFNDIVKACHAKIDKRVADEAKSSPKRSKKISKKTSKKSSKKSPDRVQHNQRLKTKAIEELAVRIISTFLVRHWNLKSFGSVASSSTGSLPDDNECYSYVSDDDSDY